MYRHYDSNASRLRFAAPYTKLCVWGAALTLLASVPFVLTWVLRNIPDNYFINDYTLQRVALLMETVGYFTASAGLRPDVRASIGTISAPYSPILIFPASCPKSAQKSYRPRPSVRPILRRCWILYMSARLPNQKLKVSSPGLCTPAITGRLTMYTPSGS